MTRTLSRDGVRLSYPTNWDADEEADGDAWTVTLQSPGTAFVLVALRPDADGPGALADETLDALKAEYTGVEAEPVVESLAGSPAVGYDADFIALDTVVEATIRCIDTTAGPLLLLAQAVGPELEQYGAVIDAVLASVVLEEA